MAGKFSHSEWFIDFYWWFSPVFCAHVVPATRTATAGNVYENQALQRWNCACQSSLCLSGCQYEEIHTLSRFMMNRFFIKSHGLICWLKPQFFWFLACMCTGIAMGCHGHVKCNNQNLETLNSGGKAPVCRRFNQGYENGKTHVRIGLPPWEWQNSSADSHLIGRGSLEDKVLGFIAADSNLPTMSTRGSIGPRLHVALVANGLSSAESTRFIKSLHEGLCHCCRPGEKLSRMAMQLPALVAFMWQVFGWGTCLTLWLSHVLLLAEEWG